MRTDIYYWKCDAPASAEAKRSAFFQDKYDRPGLAAQVADAVRAALGEAPRTVTPLRVDGNHFAFRITVGDRDLFFRAADGDDDYMLAESCLMELAADAGVPAPRIFHTDVDGRTAPFRFQIMERCSGTSLADLQREDRLDERAIGEDLGRLLRRLHGVALDGFGFLDTDELRRTGRPRGLHRRYADYVTTRLDDHLGYLEAHELLSRREAGAVRDVLRGAAPLLARTRGALVHRDPAFWNLLGTPQRITGLVDWDDAVSGDPADDLGMLHCFHDAPFLDAVRRGYWAGAAEPDDFRQRVHLHMLRNMLWKTVIRHSLGYFDKGDDFFLNRPGATGSLRDRTLATLRGALALVTEGEPA